LQNTLVDENNDLDFLFAEPTTITKEVEELPELSQISEVQTREVQTREVTNSSIHQTNREKETISGNKAANLPNYQELCNSPSLHAETLQYYFPDLYKEKEAAEKVRNEFHMTLIIAEGHIATLSPAERKEAENDIKQYKSAIKTLDDLLFTIDRKSDEAILSLYSQKPAKAANHIEISEPPQISLVPRKETNQNDSAHSSGNQQVAEQTEQNLQNIQSNIKFATPELTQLNNNRGIRFGLRSKLI